MKALVLRGSHGLPPPSMLAGESGGGGSGQGSAGAARQIRGSGDQGCMCLPSSTAQTVQPAKQPNTQLWNACTQGRMSSILSPVQASEKKR